ncbi:MAG: HPF/RaiA family ribosome-associated protein [bacterium]|nr:HPF/RaiA family ribosome-associated protein [bacterium]
MLPTSFNIKATNMALSSELREYVERRFLSLSGIVAMSEPTLKVQIEVGRTTRHHDGDVFRAEFNLRSRHGNFRAVAERPTIYAAIDDARDELETGFGRAKGMRISFLRRSRRAMKEMLRGWYGTSMKYVRVPRFKMPRFKVPSIKWKWWKK